MFNVSAVELLVIGVVGLIVLGPERLPTVARQIGAFVGSARRMAAGFQAEMRDAMDDTGYESITSMMGEGQPKSPPVSPSAPPPKLPPATETSTEPSPTEDPADG